MYLSARSEVRIRSVLIRLKLWVPCTQKFDNGARNGREIPNVSLGGNLRPGWGPQLQPISPQRSKSDQPWNLKCHRHKMCQKDKEMTELALFSTLSQASPWLGYVSRFQRSKSSMQKVNIRFYKFSWFQNTPGFQLWLLDCPESIFKVPYFPVWTPTFQKFTNLSIKTSAN